MKYAETKYAGTSNENQGDVVATPRQRRIGRSIAALVGGFVAVVVLSLATDAALEAAHIFPPMNQPRLFTTGLLLLATVYRTAYGVVGGYIAARFAPDRPVGHALVLGAVGLGAGIAGVIATWGITAEWYPITLAVLAVPQCWLGGKLAAS